MTNSSRPIPCYVINLAAASHRRRAMENMLEAKGITPIFWPAVDGRQMTGQERNQHTNPGLLAQEYGSLTPAELGCALSHLAIYRDIVERHLPYALILEDDVLLDDNLHNMLTPGTASYAGNILSADRADMLQLSKVKRGFRLKSQPLGPHLRIYKPASDVWLASGYIITRAGARNLLDALYPVWTVADHWSRFEEKGLIRLLALTPPAVREAPEAQNSTIGVRQPRKHRPKALAARLKRVGYELIKPIISKRL